MNQINFGCLDTKEMEIRFFRLYMHLPKFNSLSLAISLFLYISNLSRILVTSDPCLYRGNDQRPRAASRTKRRMIVCACICVEDFSLLSLSLLHPFIPRCSRVGLRSAGLRSSEGIECMGKENIGQLIT